MTDSIRQHEQKLSKIWGWIAGLAVTTLVVFLLIAGYHNRQPAPIPAPPKCAPVNLGNGVFKLSCEDDAYGAELSKLIQEQEKTGMRLSHVAGWGGAFLIFQKPQ